MFGWLRKLLTRPDQQPALPARPTKGAAALTQNPAFLLNDLWEIDSYTDIERYAKKLPEFTSPQKWNGHPPPTPCIFVEITVGHGAIQFYNVQNAERVNEMEFEPLKPYFGRIRSVKGVQTNGCHFPFYQLCSACTVHGRRDLTCGQCGNFRMNLLTQGPGFLGDEALIKAYFKKYSDQHPRYTHTSNALLIGIYDAATTHEKIIRTLTHIGITDCYTIRSSKIALDSANSTSCELGMRVTTHVKSLIDTCEKKEQAETAPIPRTLMQVRTLIRSIIDDRRILFALQETNPSPERATSIAQLNEFLTGFREQERVIEDQAASLKLFFAQCRKKAEALAVCIADMAIQQRIHGYAQELAHLELVAPTLAFNAIERFAQQIVNIDVAIAQVHRTHEQFTLTSGDTQPAIATTIKTLIEGLQSETLLLT